MRPAYAFLLWAYPGGMPASKHLLCLSPHSEMICRATANAEELPKRIGVQEGADGVATMTHGEFSFGRQLGKGLA